MAKMCVCRRTRPTLKYGTYNRTQHYQDVPKQIRGDNDADGVKHVEPKVDAFVGDGELSHNNVIGGLDACHGSDLKAVCESVWLYQSTW